MIISPTFIIIIEVIFIYLQTTSTTLTTRVNHTTEVYTMYAVDKLYASCVCTHRVYVRIVCMYASCVCTHVRRDSVRTNYLYISL